MKNYLFILLLLVCGKAFSQKKVVNCTDVIKQQTTEKKTNPNIDFYESIKYLKTEGGGTLEINCDLTLTNIYQGDTNYDFVKVFKYNEITEDKDGNVWFVSEKTGGRSAQWFVC